uniref:Uncharacterized protein n=2 Tax=Bursaphelenchus xylophilus TaxID=6326 RepID=A0A1I7RUL8_BURXY
MNPSMGTTPNNGVGGGLNAFMNFANSFGGFGSSMGNQNPQNMGTQNPQTSAAPQAADGDNEPSPEDCQYVENAMRWLNQQQNRETQPPGQQPNPGCNCGFNNYGANYGQNFPGFNGNPRDFQGYGSNYNGYQPSPESMYGGNYAQQQAGPYGFFQHLFNRKKRENPTFSDKIFDFFFPLQDDFEQFHRDYQRDFINDNKVNPERTERPRRCCDCCCYLCCNSKREAPTPQKDEKVQPQNTPPPEHMRPSRPIFETPHDTLYRAPHKIIPDTEPLPINPPPEYVNHLQPPPMLVNHLNPPHIEIAHPPRILQPPVETPYPHQLRFNLKKRKR